MTATVEESQLQFSRRRILDQYEFYSNVYRQLQESGLFSSVSLTGERPVPQNVNEDENIEMSQSPPPPPGLVPVEFPPVFMFRACQCGKRYTMEDCIRTISSEFNFLNLETWVGGWNSAVCWVYATACIATFCSPTRQTRHGVRNTRNSHLWAYENPYAKIESNFQQCFSANV